MMIDDNIFRPNRHLEDENCTCEMRVGSKDFFPRRERATFVDCGLWCTCFITKTEVFFFLICALRIVIFGREFSLSTLTFHFFIYSFIRFFIYTLLLWFTRGTVGRRLRYIVNDRGLRCFSVSRTRRT